MRLNNPYSNLRGSINTERPLTLGIEPTSLCNLNCIFCPRGHVRRKKNMLSYDEFLKITEKLSPLKPFESISLVKDGEPFLNRHLIDMSLYLKEKGFSKEIRVSTNGTMIKEHLYEILSSGIDILIISLTTAKKDTYKKLCGKDILDDVEEAVEELLRAKKAKGLKKPRIILRTIDMLPHDEINLFFERWSSLADEIIVAKYQTWCGKVEGTVNTPERYPCKSIFNHLSILCDGRVVLCPMDVSGEVTLGNIFEDDPEEIWQCKTINYYRAKHLEGKFDELPLCRSCDYWRCYEDIRPLLAQESKKQTT